MNNIPLHKEYDVIIIGGGHNGLVTAAYLAKAGKRVALFERGDSLGGAAGSTQAFPGIWVNTGSLDAGLFLPEIVKDLNLNSHGLRWLENPAVVFAPQPDGRALTLWRDPQRARGEIAAFSSSDAKRYPDFLAQVRKFAGVLEAMMRVAPPALPDVNMNELLPWVRTAIKVKRLGNPDMMEFIRVLPMPVNDYLDEWFESPALKVALGVSGVMGQFLGPRSPGTTFMFLYQSMQAGQAGFRSSRFVAGGMRSLIQALSAQAALYGAEIYNGSNVGAVIIENGQAVGVRLADGTVVRARIVASSADPRTTFFDLVGASNLPLQFVREVKNYRLRASLARVNLVLRELPGFITAKRAVDRERLSGHIVLCPDLDTLERAYDEAKYGQFSHTPVLDMVIPTLYDDSLAPPGSQLLSINVFFAPTILENSEWDVAGRQLLDCVVETLAGYAPGIRDLITHSQVVTPLDMQRDLGLSNGDIYHGQMGLDQLLMMRPTAGYGRYKTPLENLFLCGAGAHPGGGVTGAPGYLAAQQILKQMH